MRPHYVYAIAAFDKDGEIEAIKIGFAFDPDKRCRTMQTGQHLELEVIARRAHDIPLGAALEEQALHKKLSDSRIRGEWFNPTEEVMDLFRDGSGDFIYE